MIPTPTSGQEDTMTTKARIRRALTALEARRVGLERLISDDLERKFLAEAEQVLKTPAATYGQSEGMTVGVDSSTGTAGFSTMTWVD